MKTNDIYVCAYPKSGITYFSFLLAAARLRHNNIAMSPTIFNIDYLVIDIHKMSASIPGDIWKDGIGNLLKSHNPFSPLPNVIYLLRNPVDTLKSFFHFRRQLGNGESVAQFLTGPDGIAGWVNHVKSWLLDNRLASQSIFVTQYENLLTNPAYELNDLAAQLGIEFSADTIAHAVEAASMERMRSLENSFTNRNPVYRQFALDFVRKTNRREIDGFGAEMIELIEAHTRQIYDAATASIGH